MGVNLTKLSRQLSTLQRLCYQTKTKVDEKVIDHHLPTLSFPARALIILWAFYDGDISRPLTVKNAYTKLSYYKTERLDKILAGRRLIMYKEDKLQIPREYRTYIT